MLELQLSSNPKKGPKSGPLHVLCLGAHCDDIDIGCGGTLLKLTSAPRKLDVTWVAFSAPALRARELRSSARRFLKNAASARIVTHEFRDTCFPSQYADIKAQFERLKELPAPDVIFTHHRADRHQDHRLIAELTWNAFRRHLILEYEVPKYEGGLDTPNAYFALDRRHVEGKIRALQASYASQRTKPWFDAETFRGLMRLRGVEAGCESGWAEGFHADKFCIA